MADILDPGPGGPKGKYKVNGSPAGAIDWPARAQDILPVIAAASDRIERERRVTADVMEAIHGAELYRMYLPASLGGGESDPLNFMQVLEAVATADASTAWCLGQGLGCSLISAFLEPDVAQEVFGPRNAVLAWGPGNPTTSAVKTDGGYRVSGCWHFASGSPNATWVGGHSTLCDAEGTPIRNADGNTTVLTAMIPADKATFTDVWHVIGLRGTGSNDYEVKDLFVPESHMTMRDDPDRRQEDGPLYHVPILTMYGMGFSGVALGIARATLDAFMELSRTKKASGFTAPLAEDAVVQSQVAQMEGAMGAARAQLVEMIQRYWDSICETGDVPLDLKARLRIAITHAIATAREVVQLSYLRSGTNAIFEGGPFERRLRDIFTLSQQGQAHFTNYQFSGQALYGTVPPRRL